MANRKHFTVYWDEQEERDLMEKLEKVARREKRSKSSTAIVALREYVKRYLDDDDADSILGEESACVRRMPSKHTKKESRISLGMSSLQN